MYEDVIIVGIVFGSILLIVAMGVFGCVFRTHVKARALREQSLHESEHLALLARLEQRIEVLERIVTDERFESKRRFRET